MNPKYQTTINNASPHIITKSGQPAIMWIAFYHDLPRLDLINVMSWKHLSCISTTLPANFSLVKKGH